MTSPSRVYDVQMPPQGMGRGRDFFIGEESLEVVESLGVGDTVTCYGPMAWSKGKIIDLSGDYAKVMYMLNGEVRIACILKRRLKKI